MFSEIQSLKDNDLYIGVDFTFDMRQTKENIKQSGLSESKKRLLLNRIDQLIQTYDNNIFKLASEME